MKEIIPGTYIECDVLKEDLINGNNQANMIARFLKEEIKGNQIKFYQSLINCGYVLNPSSKNQRTSLDNYITRCQKKFRVLKNTCYSGFPEVDIFYGKIGKDGQFGYYLEIKK